MNDIEKKEIDEFDSEEFFHNVKELKHEMTDENINQIYDNCLFLLNKYKGTNQVDAMKKIIFFIDIIEKERTLVKMGFSTYINRQHIDFFIKGIKGNEVTFLELARFQREIPDDIVKKVELTKSIFDNFYVLFTDYSKMHKKVQARQNINYDPIIFGVFEDENNVMDRFYFIGDWIDEYCDLTLDKMVSICKKENVDIIKKIYTSDKLASIKKELDSLEFKNGKYVKIKIKKSLFQKIKDFLNGL